MKKCLIWLLPLCLCVWGCGEAEEGRPANASSEAAESIDGPKKIAVAIDGLPDWSATKADTWTKEKETFNRQLSRAMRQILPFDTPLVRRSIELYIAEKQSAKAFGPAEKGKLFILNRALFEVPEGDKSESYGGFAVPSDAGRGWPINSAGIVESPSTAPAEGEYRALEEFEDFSAKYKRRQV